MPVNSTHPDYDANLPAWLRARDVFAGEDAVKLGGIKYLPRLDSQTDIDYLGYKSRACFFNATSRTADGERQASAHAPRAIPKWTPCGETSGARSYWLSIAITIHSSRRRLRQRVGK